MFFPIPSPFSSKERRVTKGSSTDSLDRPVLKTGYASIFKQDEQVQASKPVSPNHPVAWSIRNRGIV